MQYQNTLINKRKPTRLKDYCYAEPNYYFVTICTHEHQHWFGDIVFNKMELNQYGMIAKKHWCNLPAHYSNCILDQYVIMPNHLHGIIIIDYSINHHEKTKYSISEIIRGFKTFSAREINHKNTMRFSWQRSFYDHIIRNERTLYEIRKYMDNNPLQWDLEKNGAENIC